MEPVPQTASPPKHLPRYEHLPYSNPTVVGSARSWSEAFEMALDLLANGQLTGLSITRSNVYPTQKRFLIMRLADRGEPTAVLRWMAEFTPLIYPSVRSVDLYLCEGRIRTPEGLEDSWRLDIVHH